MRQSSRTLSGEQKNILAYGQHFLNVNIKVSNATATLTNGVLLAGTIVDNTGKSVNTALDGATAFGVVYEDVDFTNSKGTEVVPVTIHGFVKTSELPAAPVTEVKAALKMIQFL